MRVVVGHPGHRLCGRREILAGVRGLGRVRRGGGVRGRDLAVVRAVRGASAARRGVRRGERERRGRVRVVRVCAARRATARSVRRVRFYHNNKKTTMRHTFWGIEGRGDRELTDGSWVRHGLLPRHTPGVVDVVRWIAGLVVDRLALRGHVRGGLGPGGRVLLVGRVPRGVSGGREGARGCGAGVVVAVGVAVWVHVGIITAAVAVAVAVAVAAVADVALTYGRVVQRGYISFLRETFHLSWCKTGQRQS